MCPACLTTLALIPGGAGLAGGVAAVIVQKLRGENAGNDPAMRKPADVPAKEEDCR